MPNYRKNSGAPKKVLAILDRTTTVTLKFLTSLQDYKWFYKNVQGYKFEKGLWNIKLFSQLRIAFFNVSM